MALNIKNEETDRLARTLAEMTGESITESVRKALRERLERLQGRKEPHRLQVEIERMQQRIASLPRRGAGSDEELLDYDERGLPR